METPARFPGGSDTLYVYEVVGMLFVFQVSSFILQYSFIPIANIFLMQKQRALTYFSSVAIEPAARGNIKAIKKAARPARPVPGGVAAPTRPMCGLL